MVGEGGEGGEAGPAGAELYLILKAIGESPRRRARVMWRGVSDGGSEGGGEVVEVILRFE